MKPSQPQIRPDAGANIPLATKARQVEAWLDALPLGDPIEIAVTLAQYLAAHDRADIPAGLRRQLLDILTPAIRRTLNSLAREFRDMPLPMDERELAHVDRALTLLAVVADFNQRLGAESSERSLPLFGTSPLAGDLSRFLHARLAVMDICHISHRQLPEGFWLDVHQAGQRLIQAELADTADPVNPGSTLRRVYLALLLEASADPYHLSGQERLWVIDIIARHGGLAQVVPVQDVTHGGVFGIRLHQDQPPYPLSWHYDGAPDCDLVLDTAALVRKLALIVSQLERGRVPEQDIPAVRPPGYKDLLLRLKLTWGGSAQRISARYRPAQRSQRGVLVGLDAIHRHFAEAGAATGAQECVTVNASPGGMALAVTRPGFRLRVGSLVCVCAGHGHHRRELGLVRWFKTGQDGALSFGIKFLQGMARPVIWQRPGDGRPIPCLLLEPETGRHGASRRLVVPARALGVETRIPVRGRDAVVELDLAARIEATPEVDILRCGSGG